MFNCDANRHKMLNQHLLLTYFSSFGLYNLSKMSDLVFSTIGFIEDRELSLEIFKTAFTTHIYTKFVSIEQCSTFGRIEHIPTGG